MKEIVSIVCVHAFPFIPSGEKLKKKMWVSGVPTDFLGFPRAKNKRNYWYLVCQRIFSDSPGRKIQEIVGICCATELHLISLTEK